MSPMTEHCLPQCSEVCNQLKVPHTLLWAVDRSWLTSECTKTHSVDVFIYKTLLGQAQPYKILTVATRFAPTTFSSKGKQAFSVIASTAWNHRRSESKVSALISFKLFQTFLNNKQCETINSVPVLLFFLGVSAFSDCLNCSNVFHFMMFVTYVTL